MKLKGSVVFITGAAKRVGRVTALELASGGSHIVLHYNRSEREAKALQAQIKKIGSVKVGLVQGELSRYSEVRRVADEAWRIFGRIDVLVNNASTFYPTPLGKVREEQWDDLFAVNAKAPFFLMQEIGIKMKKRGKGRIINIGDWSALHPYVQYVPYCASKAALVALSQGMARSLAPEVLVNTIMPGPVMWPSDLGEKIKMNVIKKTPLARIGRPEDVASAVRFFIEGNDFMTGSQLHVDGGRHID